MDRHLVSIKALVVLAVLGHLCAISHAGFASFPRHAFGGMRGAGAARTGPWASVITEVEDVQALHGFVQATAVNTTFPSTINVMDYGAAGDGNTDDSAAFIQALSDMGGAGGGVVLVPRGML